ncbi:MAG: efflux RND transporter periplasmic adaptor subunit [Planctomycetota bacterium]|nr:MAG: efflux RND transporter periplasmic adaptor subunit [Planctomycetota bacterium]
MISKMTNGLLSLVKVLSKSAYKLATVVRTMPKWKLQILLVLAILVSAFAIAEMFILTRKAPAKEEKKFVIPLVRVQSIYHQDIQMVVQGYGTVQPKVQAEVVPQVSGKVVAINPDFKDGGFVKAGEALISIDPRDYELSVQRAQADVARAEVELDIERAEAEVSRQEWEQLNPGTEPPSPLIVREPQIRQAQTRLEAAKAALATVELNLERTKVTLPFDGRVVSETVDLGQYVNTGQLIGKVYSVEAVEIEVPLEDRELAWFDVPASPVSINVSDIAKTGSIVEVIAHFAGGTHIWQGRVVRTTGQVDKTSRLVTVVVEVAEPFKGANGRPPLVPGMFVEVLIKGKTLENAIPVPRDAIRQGNKVWVVESGRLHIQQLEIARSDQNFVYTTSGLDDGAVIVLSSLDAATEGIKVRTQLETSSETEKFNRDSNEPESVEAQ